MKLLTPGLVFADDATKFADALRANVPAGTEIAASRGAVPGRDVTMLAELLATPEHPRLDAAHDAIGPDTIAKFLLTSGSTGNPKAVINTQRMISANQVMLRETLAFLKDEPPVIVDWLPWNHTFGGNHNIGLTLFNGGSMYLDEGKPMPGGIEETVRNLREISPTVYFNVPKGYESLLPYLRDDARCDRNSSRACTRCSSPARRCRPMSGTRSTNWRCRKPASGADADRASAPPKPRRSSCRSRPPPAAPAMSACRCRAMTQN